MSLVAQYTRDQWEAIGGWHGVEAQSTDGVILLFSDDPTVEDVEVEVIRKDTANKWTTWPEDVDKEQNLQPIPFQYWKKRDDGNGYELEETGESIRYHERVGLRRPSELSAPNDTPQTL